MSRGTLVNNGPFTADYLTCCGSPAGKCVCDTGPAITDRQRWEGIEALANQIREGKLQSQPYAPPVAVNGPALPSPYGGHRSDLPPASADSDDVLQLPGAVVENAEARTNKAKTTEQARKARQQVAVQPSYPPNLPPWHNAHARWQRSQGRGGKVTNTGEDNDMLVPPTMRFEEP